MNGSKNNENEVLNSERFAITNHKLNSNSTEATHSTFYPCDENQKLLPIKITNKNADWNMTDNDGDDQSITKKNS